MNNILAIGVVLVLLLQLIGVVGFAYIIFAVANKESGLVKLAGQAIAVVLILISLAVAFLGAGKANLVKRYTLGQGRSVVK